MASTQTVIFDTYLRNKLTNYKLLSINMHIMAPENKAINNAGTPSARRSTAIFCNENEKRFILSK